MNGFPQLPEELMEISDEQYSELFSSPALVEIKMIKKDEPCKHEVGDRFYFKGPYGPPEGVCHALLHVLNLYIWRAALGFPSWETADRSVYKIHCPAKDGTVWEMRRVEKKA